MGRRNRVGASAHKVLDHTYGVAAAECEWGPVENLRTRLSGARPPGGVDGARETEREKAGEVTRVEAGARTRGRGITRRKTEKGKVTLQGGDKEVVLMYSNIQGKWAKEKDEIQRIAEKEGADIVFLTETIWLLMNGRQERAIWGRRARRK